MFLGKCSGLSVGNFTERGSVFMGECPKECPVGEGLSGVRVRILMEDYKSLYVIIIIIIITIFII